MHWTLHHPKFSFEMLGYLPTFLTLTSPLSAKEQININYRPGWSSFKGFTLNEDNSLSYPYDPPLFPLASTILRDDLICYYRSSWVAIIQPNRTFDVARID